MTLIKKLPRGYAIKPFQKQPFYEYSAWLSFPFTNLAFWQVLEMKNFAKKTAFVQLQDYGFNGETKQGKGTLNIFKLKNWTKTERIELEEILGEGIVNFLFKAA